MNIVDDPYMVRIEALQQLGATGDAFRELAKAWMPKDDMPSLRDLFAAYASAGAISNELFRREASHNPKVIAEFAYEVADAMMKERNTTGSSNG